MARFSSNYSANEKVIWLCENTRSLYANFVSYDSKLDGSIWAKIEVLPSLSNSKPYLLTVPLEQIVPAF